MSNIERAVILAGGVGSRLHPYTICYPKPMMPVGKYPILEIVVRQLVRSGCPHITMAVNHLAEIIRAFFGDGTRWGVTIDYSMEDEPVGTMGPLRLIENLPENFIVMNGDIVTDLDYLAFYRAHVASGRQFTVSASRREERTDYGVLDVGEDGVLTGFREKPLLTYDVSMGVYAVARGVLAHIPEGKPFGFDNLMNVMLDKGDPVGVERYGGLWLDIGRPSDYAKAAELFELHEDRLIGGLA